MLKKTYMELLANRNGNERELVENWQEVFVDCVSNLDQGGSWLECPGADDFLAIVGVQFEKIPLVKFEELDVGDFTVESFFDEFGALGMFRDLMGRQVED